MELEDYAGRLYYALYTHFRVNYGPLYTLEISGYDAFSTLIDSMTPHNGSPFSTKDRDNDSYSGHCALNYKGAWWYESCHNSNLNGFNYFNSSLPQSSSFNGNGIVWNNQKNYNDQYHYFSWPKVEMKIRKQNK